MVRASARHIRGGRALWAGVLAMLLGSALGGCSAFGESAKFTALPAKCFAGIEPAVGAAVGALASVEPRDDSSLSDNAFSNSSSTSKYCALSYNDTRGRTNWKQGDPYFRRIFVEYDLYTGGFLSPGVEEAKRQVKPALVDPKYLVPEPGIGDEAVGWWDDSSNQGASWQISLRVSNMRVLVRLAGADYLKDYTEVRRYSPEWDNSSPRFKDELRSGAQIIAKAAVDQLYHPSAEKSD